MIRHTTGNLLTADVDALVNTVNTVGVAGKGIALQFRQAYPDNFKAYTKAAKNGGITPGRMYVYATGRLQPRYIINFPTKRHWRGASKISDIVSGLEDLAETIKQFAITSIAVPPLGCGNGGLSWSDVRPLIVGALGEQDVDVLLFAPEGAPLADSMPVATERPKMTLGRAVMLLLMDQYRDIDEYRLTALEAQKLAYFMQEGGESLRLNFTKAQFGP
ncbi:MAG: type II toxin-antitoxin system antitoxin DNA ADP-ribosyl glycohydrolase DarG, partial [Candidatus Angelobacter sp.]